jgi:hypothetical protein
MERGCFEIRKKLLKNKQFSSVIFDEVRFIGVFSGCDFGSFQGDHASLGGLLRGDFSHATLDQCRLMGVDIAGCAFSGWPTVLVMEPRKHAVELTSIDFPGEWGVIATTLAEQPEWCSAVALDVALLKRECGGQDQELRTIVRAHSFMKTRE